MSFTEPKGKKKKKKKADRVKMSGKSHLSKNEKKKVLIMFLIKSVRNH